MSRTDSIGDVVLTLPMAGFIKHHFPGCRVYFMGRTYTKDVVGLSAHVDEFINYDELEKLPAAEQREKLRAYKADVLVHVFPKKEIAKLAAAAGIELRVGTTSRWYHWLYCNRLLKLSRKNSDLHEAQLNLKLLAFLNVPVQIPLKELPQYYGFTRVPALHAEYAQWLDKGKINLILHPRSKGSAREWGLDNFGQLAQLLPADRYKIFVSGTADDGAGMKELLQNSRITDLTGKLPLQQFIAFINASDGLVAASTGPLHIAAALGKRAIGLFAPMRPIHPGRWAPLGPQASFLVKDAACENCKNGKPCHCIREISPQRVAEQLNRT